MGKKLLLSLSAVFIFIFCFSVVGFADTFIMGDVNRSGQVEADDARSILRYSVGLDSASAFQKTCADMDIDGNISAADARLALRTSVGLESETYFIYDDSADDKETEKKDEPDSARETAFKEYLYDYSQNFYDSENGYGAAFNDSAFYREHNLTETIYGTAGKWCCFYTIHDILRPSLRNSGYSEARIEELAPLYYPKKTIATAISNIAKSETNSFSGLSVPSFLISSSMPFYIPSVLADYYQNASEDICEMYTLYEYYDDVVSSSVIKRSKNASSYEPEVGDVVFMSNKVRTYVNGYPTVDHTAQIIKVYENGSFLCTEGSIIVTDTPDELPRVRQRRYIYNSAKKTYVYKNNDVVVVLACAKLNLE